MKNRRLAKQHNALIVFNLFELIWVIFLVFSRLFIDRESSWFTRNSFCCGQFNSLLLEFLLAWSFYRQLYSTFNCQLTNDSAFKMLIDPDCSNAPRAECIFDDILRPIPWISIIKINSIFFVQRTNCISPFHINVMTICGRCSSPLSVAGFAWYKFSQKKLNRIFMPLRYACFRHQYMTSLNSSNCNAAKQTNSVQMTNAYIKSHSQFNSWNVYLNFS